MVISAEIILFVVMCLLSVLEYGITLKLLELDVPKDVPLGTRAALSCRWQLGPTEALYSVKWYKDGKEFFRHVPRDVEPRRKFPLPGVDVEDSDPSGSWVVLSPATVSTGGRYRCEVSGEKPLFPTVSEHKDLTIVVLPDHGPVLLGFLPKYRIGDTLQVTCVSGRSKPASQLSWYINGEPLPLERTSASYRSENGLIVTKITLNFEVNEKHFRRQMLKVKCLATIFPIYWKSNEGSAVEEKSKGHYDITATTDVAVRNDEKNMPSKSSKKLPSLSLIGVAMLVARIY